MAEAHLPYPVILPCGGKSSRMGVTKGLLNVKGRPWLEIQLERLCQVGVSRVIVVLGYDAEKYLEALPWSRGALSQWFQVFGAQVMWVRNPHPEWGPFTSLQTAIHPVESWGAPAAFFLPVDVPCPDIQVWQSLVCDYGENVSAVIPSYEKRGGHPVLLGRKLLLELLRIPMDAADARLDIQLHKLRHLVYVDVDDPRVLMNINTPEDIAILSLPGHQPDRNEA